MAEIILRAELDFDPINKLKKWHFQEMAFSCSAGYELNLDTASIRDRTDKKSTAFDALPSMEEPSKIAKSQVQIGRCADGHQASCLGRFLPQCCEPCCAQLMAVGGTSPIGLWIWCHARPWTWRHMRP